MSTGSDKLREELEAVRAALRGFDDPVVEQLPGLRVMREALRERSQLIRDSLAKAETAALQVTLEGDPVSEGGLAAPFAVELVAALQDAVTASGGRQAASWVLPPEPAALEADLTLHLADLQAADDSVTLRLERAPGPLPARLADPESGAPLVELAMDAVLARLDPDSGDSSGDQVAVPAARALLRLARLVASVPVSLTLAFSPAALEARELTFSRADAQRLAETLAAG